MEFIPALAMGAVGLCLGVIVVGLIGLPPTRLTRPLLGIAVCSACWAVGDQITAYSRDMTEEQVGIAVLYTGSIFLPALWLWLALGWAEESGRPLRIDLRYAVGVPLVWAALMWGAMITNPWHGRFIVPVIGDRNLLTPLWWAMGLPNYALILAGAGVVGWVAARVRTPEVRRQAAVLLGASLFTLFWNWMYVLWPESPRFNATLLVLVIASGLLFLGLRAELERRRFHQRLQAEVAQRTEELDATNRKLRLANSRLRELQAKLVQAERLEAADYLAGAVAHAIHNPLAALRGTLELAVEQNRDATLERAMRLADRVKDVVDGTLDLVRRSALRLEPEPPRRLLQDARDELAERAEAQGVTLELYCEPDLIEPLVDWPLFVAALVALAENSLDAMPEGGRLTLQAESIPGDHAIAFTVADTGPGIPESMRAKAFEPFYTTKPEGTGLGLAIARGVVQGHGGRIHLTDGPEGGALVRVEIPVRAASSS